MSPFGMGLCLKLLNCHLIQKLSQINLGWDLDFQRFIPYLAKHKMAFPLLLFLDQTEDFRKVKVKYFDDLIQILYTSRCSKDVEKIEVFKRWHFYIFFRLD